MSHKKLTVSIHKSDSLSILVSSHSKCGSWNDSFNHVNHRRSFSESFCHVVYDSQHNRIVPERPRNSESFSRRFQSSFLSPSPKVPLSLPIQRIDSRRLAWDFNSQRPGQLVTPFPGPNSWNRRYCSPSPRGHGSENVMKAKSTWEDSKGLPSPLAGNGRARVEPFGRGPLSLLHLRNRHICTQSVDLGDEKSLSGPKPIHMDSKNFRVVSIRIHELHP
jgi:hypothetical protein